MLVVRCSGLNESSEQKFYINFWRYGKDLMVVACDSEILGAKLESGDLKIIVSKEFYGGMLVDSREALNYLKSASIINIIGVRIVKLALEAGLIHKDAIITIGGQPHAQFIRVNL